MRNPIKNLAIVLGLVACLGCGDNSRDSKPNPEITLGVSEAANIVDRYGLSKGCLRYCGMPSEKTFSLGLAFNHGGLNDFYSASRTNIDFYGTKLEILSVNTETIKFRVIDKPKK